MLTKKDKIYILLSMLRKNSFCISIILWKIGYHSKVWDKKEKNNTFILQRDITLIKSGSKDIYNVTNELRLNKYSNKYCSCKHFINPHPEKCIFFS